MRVGQKVYIKELKQFGEIKSIIYGKVRHVQIDTPSGPEVIDILTKGYTIIKIVAAIIEVLKQIWTNLISKEK